MSSDYKECLELAGAEVKTFQVFGDWQGTWYAYVVYRGEEGWISGSYGSCSGCDAFYAEFGFVTEGCSDHPYHPREGCARCAHRRAELRDAKAEFGRTYLETILPHEVQVKILRDRLNSRGAGALDEEEREILTFIEEFKENELK